jgi:hypothetical protein
MKERQRVLILSSICAALIDLTAIFTDRLPAVVGVPILLACAGAAFWSWRQGPGGAGRKPASPFEEGLRVAERPFDTKKTNMAHGLEVIVRTEARVALGLRLVCDTPIYEVDPLAQTGRGPDARRRVPKTVRESRQSWLFIVSNSAREIETILKVTFLAPKPIHLTRVELIKQGEIDPSQKEPAPASAPLQAEAASASSVPPAPLADAVPVPETAAHAEALEPSSCAPPSDHAESAPRRAAALEAAADAAEEPTAPVEHSHGAAPHLGPPAHDAGAGAASVDSGMGGFQDAGGGSHGHHGG